MHAYKLKLAKIAVDFVKDEHEEQYWFTGVKYFEVDEHS